MKNKVILVLAFSLFAFCQGRPECGPEQCNDLWTAKKCDKVSFCISEHWSKLKPTGNRDNVCDICLRMVKEARDTLQSNETREQLLQVFEGSCRLLVLKPAVKVCDKIVDQFVPELVEILSSEMDPETVCSVAKLCNNEVFRASQKESEECAYCEKFTENAEKQMEAVSSEQFRNKILNLCRTAGTFSDACAHFGLEYSNLLYNNSKIILSTKPCEASSICPSGLVNSQSAFEVKKKMCPLCMNVMANFREQLLRVKSAEDFTENILSVCERMGFSDSACSKISNPSLYEKLKSWNTLPNIFCQITYCRSKSEEEDIPFWPLVPAHSGSFSSSEELNTLELLENIQMFFPVVEEQKTELPRPVISYGDPIENPVFFAPSFYVTEPGACRTCTDLIEKLANSNKTDKEYSEKILNNICDKMQNVEVCKRFIDNFSPVLRKIYVDGVASSKICEDLVPSCKVKQVDSPPEPFSQDDTCNFCLNTVRVFKYGDTASWNQILNEKCSTLPENSRNICTSAFTHFLSVFKNFTEDGICNSLKYCRSSATVLPDASNAHAQLNQESYCEICVKSLSTLSEWMKNPQSEVIVRLTFDFLCSLLPYNESKMCRNLVDVIGINELKKFLENLKPNSVCHKIHLCEEKELDLTSLSLPDVSTEIISTETTKKIPCKFCLMAVNTLLDQLQNDKTEESIREALNKLCKYLPEETRDTCRNLIDEYTEDLIDMIIADFNASEICMFLKICPAQRLFGDSYKKDFPVFDIHTNEVRKANGWKQTLRTSSVKNASLTVAKPRKEDFQKFHKVVQECALCEALVGVISTHEKMMSKDYDFSANAHYICSIVPANKRRMCVSMIVSYGPSIVNLIVDKRVDPNRVCVRVDLCDPKMQARVSLPVSVAEEKFIPKEKNDCLRGPVFWCANAENAEKCGTFLHCQETVWKNWENPPKRPAKD